MIIYIKVKAIVNKANIFNKYHEDKRKLKVFLI